MSDLISRQAAIDEIKEFKNGAAEWRDEQEEYSDIWHRADSAIASALEIGLRVKKLPSAQPDLARDIATIIENEKDMRVILKNAQPERKKGKWVEEDDAIIHGHCSNCGWMSIWQETDVFGMNFCPNCGAKMSHTKEKNNRE